MLPVGCSTVSVRADPSYIYQSFTRMKQNSTEFVCLDVCICLELKKVLLNGKLATHSHKCVWLELYMYNAIIPYSFEGK